MFNQNRYISEYNKSTYKMYQFRVRKDNEKMIRYLDKKAERNRYIISLIENNIEKEKILSIKKIKEIIKPILNSYGRKDIYLFGSYARGEADSESDVDIYCDKGNIRTMIDQGRLEEKLKKSLKRNVDIVFESSDKDEFFEKQIMEDMIKLC